MSNNITLITNHSAVDATIITKCEAVEEIRKRYGFSIDQIATIGDEIGDLSMLEIPGLGSVGTVANAQQRVIEFISSKENGYVADKPVFDGFMDFYSQCQNQGIKLVVTDKDGVLKEGKDVHWGPQFAKLIREMGSGNPYCIVLTASALSQNTEFRHQYGLDDRLKDNPTVQDNPYLLLVENGAIHVNVLTGETKNYCHKINPELLKVLKGPFEEQVARRIEQELLPEFGFGISYSYGEQRGKVYHIRDKQAGVCFNIPREDNEGRPFRNTPEAQKLRNREIEIMAEVADNLSIDYVVL